MAADEVSIQGLGSEHLQFELAGKHAASSSEQCQSCNDTLLHGAWAGLCECGQDLAACLAGLSLFGIALSPLQRLAEATIVPPLSTSSILPMPFDGFFSDLPISGDLTLDICFYVLSSFAVATAIVSCATCSTLWAREQELLQSQDTLQACRHELQQSQSALRASGQELRQSQSTLQARSQELQTVQKELRTRAQELCHCQKELLARSWDLQESQNQWRVCEQKLQQAQLEGRAALEDEASARRRCLFGEEELQVQLQRECIFARNADLHCTEELSEANIRMESLQAEIRANHLAEMKQCRQELCISQASLLQLEQERHDVLACSHQEQSFRVEAFDLQAERASEAHVQKMCNDQAHVVKDDLTSSALRSASEMSVNDDERSLGMLAMVAADEAQSALAMATKVEEEYLTDAGRGALESQHFSLAAPSTSLKKSGPDGNTKLLFIAREELKEAIRDFKKPSAGAGTIQKILRFHPDCLSFEENFVQRVRHDTCVFLPADVMLTSNDHVPLTMLLEFLSWIPKQPVFTDRTKQEFHVVVPLALKVGQALSDMQKKITGGVSGHWAALNFNFGTKQIEFFDPKGDGLESAGQLGGGFVSRPTQFELRTGGSAGSSGRCSEDDLLWRTYHNLNSNSWRSFRNTLTGSETLRMQPRELVDFLTHVATSQATESSELSALPSDLRWLKTFGFEQNAPAESSEQLQFDHVSCPSFAIWFALERGSEGYGLCLKSFVARMKAELVKLSGADMSRQVAEAGIKAWRDQLANCLIVKV